MNSPNGHAQGISFLYVKDNDFSLREGRSQQKFLDCGDSSGGKLNRNLTSAIRDLE
jgi:hypothetical protein